MYMIGRLFGKLWRIFNVSRLIILNLIFFLFLFLFIVVIVNSGDEKVVVPSGAALVLDLKGQLVEQKSHIDPFDAFATEAMGQEEDNPEVLLSDIFYAIEHAKNNENIKALVLKLDNLQKSGLSKLQDVGGAIANFKASGKPVIALGDQFSQEQYYVASYADEIWLNPKGWLLLEGFGRYSLFFKSALEKLAINQHIFRVGTYKSAIEPFIRDDMSEEAKEANALWLDELWTQYKQDVAKQRAFTQSNFDETTDSLIRKLTTANGNLAEYALENKFVDALKTREQMRKGMIKLVGKNDDNTFTHINFKNYLKATKPAIPFDNPYLDKIAIVVAKGTILNGNQKAGTIGGTSTAKLLRKARYDEQVKAVVLRVDSPGGSAFASEIIRQEVELLKAAGKPVIASMGTYAASGGYWISAPADKIIASPATITGSIGIFGLFMTFEDSLAKLGIYTDGVGTTEFSGAGPTQPINKGIAKIIQLNIERGYQDFITLVAESRDMTIAEVDKIAQGRIWSGVKAKELGLVDELGNLNDAILAAAKLAGLEQYETKVIEKELSKMDLFLKEAFGQAGYLFAKTTNNSVTQGPASHFMQQLKNNVKQLDAFNDPNSSYLFCDACILE